MIFDKMLLIYSKLKNIKGLMLMSLKKIFRAVKTNNIQHVQFLLEKALKQKTSIDIINRFETNDETGWNTLLNWAVACKHADVVDLLLQHGANPNTPAALDQKYNAPLHFAILNNCGKIARLILQNPRTRIDQPNRWGQTALHLAASKDHSIMVQLILYYLKRRNLNVSAHLNLIDDSLISPLHHAAQHRSGVIAKILLNYDILLEQKDSSRETPLHWAVYHKTDTVVRLFIERKMDVNSKNLWGNTVLHLAATSDSESAVQIAHLLLRNGINSDSTNSAKITPLQLAARNNQVLLVKLLLEHGANVHHQDRDKRTVLHHAVFDVQNLDLVCTLVQQGADPCQRDETGHSALHSFSSDSQQKTILQHYCKYVRKALKFSDTFSLEAIEIFVKAKHDPILAPWLTQPLGSPFFRSPKKEQIMERLETTCQKTVDNVGNNANYVNQDDLVAIDFRSNQAIRRTCALPNELQIKIWGYVVVALHSPPICQNDVESLLYHLNRPDREKYSHSLESPLKIYG